MGFAVDNVALGQVFPQVLRFPLPVLIPSTAPYSSIIREWYKGPISGRRTKPYPTKLKEKCGGDRIKTAKDCPMARFGISDVEPWYVRYKEPG
jgi:hypothetical protein